MTVAKKQRSAAGPVLGLDTATRAGSVAVVAAGRVLGGLDVSGRLDHSERLLPAMDFLLGRLDLETSDLRGVAVTTGPGSFTGVRVGLATALGLARAAGLPAAGVGTLEALAAGVDRPPDGIWLCPWLDAGRGEVYAAAYAVSGGVLREERAPGVGPPGPWLEELPSAVDARFVGEGAEAYRELLERGRGASAVLGSGPWFLARTVARLGEERLAAGAVPAPAPVYLRSSDAERSRGRER